uniref:TWiK family of potassium channels protein 18 n=2 Tax=Lygus hesperus TaxID=30085 RepID=A0A0A9YAP1_LYGHE
MPSETVASRSSSCIQESPRRERTWGQKIKDGIRTFLAFMFSNVGIICLVVGYTIAGSFVFMTIEGSVHNTRTHKVAQERNKTAEKLWRLTCCEYNPLVEDPWKSAANESLLAFQRFVVAAVLEQGYEGEDYGGNRWSFSGSFLYSLTVITTIGYGNVVPRTEWGKLATVCYAIVGLPLFLLYLSNIGSILAQTCKWIYFKCFLCTGCKARRQAFMIRQESDYEMSIEEYLELSRAPEFKPQAVTVPITLCLSIIIGYLYGGAVLFARWERWGLLDGAYFCFISLSTIGFGDIVPGDMIEEGEGIELKFIFCSMYLLLGMALIAMCFNLMQEEVMHKLKVVGEGMRAVFRCNN